MGAIGESVVFMDPLVYVVRLARFNGKETLNYFEEFIDITTNEIRQVEQGPFCGNAH